MKKETKFSFWYLQTKKPTKNEKHREDWENVFYIILIPFSVEKMFSLKKTRQKVFFVGEEIQRDGQLPSFLERKEKEMDENAKKKMSNSSHNSYELENL